MNRRHHRWMMTLVIELSFVALQSQAHWNVAEAADVAIFPPGVPQTGYKLGLLAMACSLGGLWSDAEGVPPADWRKRDDQRCNDLVVSVYGQFDVHHYERLRAGDAEAVSDLLDKIRKTDPAATRERTAKLFRDAEAATHETMYARRASDRVKIDYDADEVEAKLSDDQRTAAKALAKHGALERLLVTTDPNAADRRTIGLLLALERMDMARGLPKQLKFYALGYVLATVFDVAPPPASLRPTSAPVRGAWLAYLSNVAARAGYPVPNDPALTFKSRETLAWTGVEQGFADRLDQYLKNLPAAAVPELSRVSSSVSARLATEHATAQKITQAQVNQQSQPASGTAPKATTR